MLWLVGQRARMETEWTSSHRCSRSWGRRSLPKQCSLWRMQLGTAPDSCGTAYPHLVTPPWYVTF